MTHSVRLLPASFYQSDDVISLAQQLLGKIIVSHIGTESCAGRIVETEAYKAPEDKGSHAYGNKKTARTSAMFGPGGHSYVYLCYGIHQLFNVVTGPADMAHAILVRAVEPLEGLPIMLKRRKMTQLNKTLTNGPGKWTQAMGITRSHNALQLFDQKSTVQVYEDLGFDIIQDIIASPRVGIAYAAEWANQPWRFRIANNDWTSLPHEVEY
jgi:DNA-3-methyladenine glycosylase